MRRPCLDTEPVFVTPASGTNHRTPRSVPIPPCLTYLERSLPTLHKAGQMHAGFSCSIHRPRPLPWLETAAVVTECPAPLLERDWCCVIGCSTPVALPKSRAGLPNILVLTGHGKVTASTEMPPRSRPCLSS